MCGCSKTTEGQGNEAIDVVVPSRMYPVLIARSNVRMEEAAAPP